MVLNVNESAPDGSINIAADSEEDDGKFEPHNKNQINSARWYSKGIIIDIDGNKRP